MNTMRTMVTMLARESMPSILHCAHRVIVYWSRGPGHSHAVLMITILIAMNAKLAKLTKESDAKTEPDTPMRKSERV
jgi:hypothetical protein